MTNQNEPMRMLGKLEPKHDPRTLKLADYLDTAELPPIPGGQKWDKGIANWQMMGNDRIGDCTCAAIGHQIQTWTANTGTEVTLSESDIIGAYSAVTGYDPHTGANDNGAYELDVLNYWHKTGIAGHKLGAFADVDVKRHDLVMAAIDLFGGIYIGVALPISAQAQIGGVWDVPPGGATGNGAPGSWGGHAINCIDYDSTGLTCVTWGALQRLTWAFWDAYVDEAHAVLGQEWFNGQQQAPSGFDLAALTADLALVSGQQPPTPTPTPPTPPTPTPPAPSDWHQPAEAVIQPVVTNLSNLAKQNPRSTAAHYRAQGAQAVLDAVKAAPA